MCSFGATSTSHAGNPRSADSVCCRASSRHVVFLTQVRQHERSRAAFHQIRCKYGAVRDWTRCPLGPATRILSEYGYGPACSMCGSWLLSCTTISQPRRSSAASRRAQSQGRSQSEPAAAVLEYVARALGCVMRRRERHNVHIPDPEALTAVEYVQTVGVLRILSSKASAVPRVANTGAFAFLRNIGSPFTWSMCSCVSTTAEISSSVSDSAFSAVVILAQRHTEIDQNCGAVRHI